MLEEDKKIHWFWSKLSLYLAQNQLKQTKQRRIIVGQFLKLNKHADAESVHASLKQAGHNIGLATIYRTLGTLKEAGLVTQHAFANGRSVFELVGPGEHHDHMVCTKCGKIEEFENCQIETLQEGIASQRGFRLEFHRLELYGTCLSCQQKH